MKLRRNTRKDLRYRSIKYFIDFFFHLHQNIFEHWMFIKIKYNCFIDKEFLSKTHLSAKFVFYEVTRHESTGFFFCSDYYSKNLALLALL